MTNYAEITEKLDKGMEAFAEASPNAVGQFFKVVEGATSAGTLDTETKELIALAIAAAVRCAPCVAHHARSAVHAGISREAVVEALGVAVMMAGGPAVAYSVSALEAFDQFTAADG